MVDNATVKANEGKAQARTPQWPTATRQKKPSDRLLGDVSRLWSGPGISLLYGRINLSHFTIWGIDSIFGRFTGLQAFGQMTDCFLERLFRLNRKPNMDTEWINDFSG
jgi:hypothetical protein